MCYRQDVLRIIEFEEKYSFRGEKGNYLRKK